MEIVSVLPQLSALRFPEVNDLNVYVWNDGAEVTLMTVGCPARPVRSKKGWRHWVSPRTGYGV
ncbi:hypothetical protein [Nocardia asiatica]|uniref:hypothetical protein n=1 Tax=Nocardia asiatica TaxID=209252 RepID=UPI003EE13B8B